MIIDLKKMIKQFPDIVTNGDKLKGILSDLYIGESKGVINTLVTIVKSGIAKEMQNITVSDLDKARWKKQLEDDYALSEKVVENCLALWLKAIATDEEKNAYTKKPITIFNAVFEIKNGVLVYYKGKNSSVVIPCGVTHIGLGAFYECRGLTSISIPDSVISIGRGAFYKCRGLTSLTIPDSVTLIESGAFFGCSGLIFLTIPDGVTTIGDRAFYGCSGLTNIVIPSSATYIADDAFGGCRNLMSITYQGTRKQWDKQGKGIFGRAIPKTCVVHCTDGDIR